ncbi:MAG: DUF5615 family PIN-like protein [Lewinellaceae bacterium]|nr:DUF5615 family PIN-like protein [Lewinellaceae bacterium]
MSSTSKTLGLTDFPDVVIFETARRENFNAILTLDEDFHNLVMERGVPPKFFGFVWAIALQAFRPKPFWTMRLLLRSF